MTNMILNLIVVSMLVVSIYSFPQNIRIPKNISPAEVNYLVEPPPRYGSNVEQQIPLVDVVNEVENMLQANPKLPRLTKGEILDLLENITKTEKTPQLIQQTSQNYQVNDNKQIRNPKAVMMVLPFTPDISENNVEDLYTKPPITQIVDYHQLGYNGEESNVVINYELPTVQFDAVSANAMSKPANDATINHGDAQIEEVKDSSTATITNRPTSTTTTELPNNHFVQRRPQNYRRKTAPTSTTTLDPPSSTNSQRRRRPDRTSPTTSTRTTQRHSNHRYEDELPAESSLSSSSTKYPATGIKIVKPPSIPAKVINEDLLALQNDHKKFYVDKEIPFSYVPVEDIDLTVGDDKEDDKGVPLVIEIPEHLKAVLSELNLESALRSKPKKHNKSRPNSTAKPTTPDKEDVQLNNLVKTLKLLAAQTSTTSTPIPDVSEVANNLSPDMKDLLMNFGLIPNPNPPAPASASHISDSYNPEKAEVSPDSYIGFKPLPEHDNTRDEMQELLAKFGLGRSFRKGKSLKNMNRESDLEMVPHEYQKILEDLGVGHRDDNSDASTRQEHLTKEHVFNPSEKLYATEEEIGKLKKLSNIVQQLESLNRTLTDDDINKIDADTLKELVASLNDTAIALNGHNKPLDEQNAPDPIDFGYDTAKNEVKRQEDNTKTENVTDQTKKEAFATIPTVDETQTANIQALEESFGGQMSTESESTPPESSTSSRRQSGFYRLIDMNLFFDMDDQKGRRVNLRFQPKVGDPSRFYSVSVP